MNRIRLSLLMVCMSATISLGSNTIRIMSSTRVENETEFTPINLMKYIKYKRIRFPKVVFAQSILESGHYSSEVYQVNHNLFGMRMPKKRPTVALRSNLNHAMYKDWQSCVDDYAMWQEYVLANRKIRTDEQYLKFLGEYGYAEAGAEKYIGRLRNILKKFVPLYLKNNEYWESRKKQT